MPDIVVFGQQVPVMEVEGANMVEHIPDDVLTAWLIEAGQGMMMVETGMRLC